MNFERMLIYLKNDTSHLGRVQGKTTEFVLELIVWSNLFNSAA